MRFIVVCRVRLASTGIHSFPFIRFVEHIAVIASFERAFIDTALFENRQDRAFRVFRMRIVFCEHFDFEKVSERRYGTQLNVCRSRFRFGIPLFNNFFFYVRNAAA